MLQFAIIKWRYKRTHASKKMKSQMKVKITTWRTWKGTWKRTWHDDEYAYGIMKEQQISSSLLHSRTLITLIFIKTVSSSLWTVLDETCMCMFMFTCFTHHYGLVYHAVFRTLIELLLLHTCAALNKFRQAATGRWLIKE